jgi:DedD protein
MGLFSFLGKNKQDRTAEDSGHFYRAADDAALGEHVRAKRASNAGEGSRRAKTAGDPMLPEKKRARRRLVGAIALALAAAVGLPMLLDSEPKPLAGDIAIQIPSKDKAAALPMPADPGTQVAAADTVDKGEEIVEAPKQPAKPPVATPPAVTPAKPAPAPQVAEVRTQSRPEPARQEPLSRPEPAKAEHVKPEPKQEAKIEPAKPEHKSPPKSEPRSEPKPEPKPESRLAAEKPKAPKAEDKPSHPLATEESARAIAILEGKQAEKAREAAAEKVVLQVAALGSAEKAAELQARLREAGIHSFTQKLSRPGGDLIRVKVGPYSRDEAEKVRAKLGKLGLSGTINPA